MMDEREIARYAVEHLDLDESQEWLFQEYLENYGHAHDEEDVEGDARQWLDEFREDYAGEYDSPGEYAEQLLEDTGSLADVPDVVRYHIDFESIARDMELNGDIWRVGDHIFTAR